MLRQLQNLLPWTVHYSRDFRANPQPHKDFAHALVHSIKASGKIAGYVDDHDHKMDSDIDRERIKNYIADQVICALRMANTIPGGAFDLQDQVIKRLETKNQVNLNL